MFTREEEAKNSIVTWAETIFMNIFYTDFKDPLWDPPSHCKQAIKDKNYVSDLSHVCPIFPLA